MPVNRSQSPFTCLASLQADAGSSYPYCPTALLPYCPTALLPYCPTAFSQIHIDNLPRLQHRRIAVGTRLDEVDELLAGLQRVDHRWRELRVGRDVADLGRQAVGAAVAAYDQFRADP